MTPGEAYLCDVYENDRFTPLEITITTNGAPLDITGAVPLMQLRAEGVELPVYEFKVENNNIGILDGPGGVVRVGYNINSFNVPAGSYAYDLQLTFPDGAVRTFIKGSLKVVADISK